jgi:raffinose/stachyose/melibiose transport system permease protein
MVYDVNLSLTKGEPYGSSVMAAMHVYNQAFTYKNYGTGQAQAFILFVVCAIIGVTQVYIGKQGEVEA